MAAKRILLTLAAASLALVAWLTWKPSSVPTHSAQTKASAHKHAPPISAGTPQTADFTTAIPQRAWFLALKQRADAGDPASQRLLAQAYDRCMYVNRNVEQYKERIQRGIQSAATEEKATVLGYLLQHVLQECAAVEGGAQIDWEDMRLLYAQAAQGGDLPARVMETVFNPQPPLSEEQATALLEEVLASHDPAAMFALGDAMGEFIGMQVAEPYTPLAEGELAGRAWQVAACRMGFECGPESPPATRLCLLQGWCYEGTYEQATRRRLGTDAEREALDRRVAAILRAMTPDAGALSREG
ncbi:hypothetical protein [uncultured Stenotrophomonas sp.]|uniref:hypothetical protein n=1 Tax=uncultured Stenotrophomonas sp. TaxID=165438 RepID=UPI0028EF31AE|nr:hypothetical protein [uncultured Stenotrophomonas sp.]